MKSNTGVDILGLPYLVAVQKVQDLGYSVGKVTYTLSPKQKNSKEVNPRVVRRRIIANGTVDLVLANSPWDYF